MFMLQYMYTGHGIHVKYIYDQLYTHIYIHIIPIIQLAKSIYLFVYPFICLHIFQNFKQSALEVTLLNHR